MERPIIDETRPIKSLQELILEQIRRMHASEEETIRWARRRRHDIQCFYTGFPEKNIRWMFNNRDANIDFDFLQTPKTWEEFKETVESWQRSYRETNLASLRKFPAYNGLFDHEIVHKILQDIPSEKEKLNEFLESLEYFQDKVRQVVAHIPDAIIPLSSRYIEYLDDDVKAVVRKCTDRCDICEPQRTIRDDIY